MWSFDFVDTTKDLSVAAKEDETVLLTDRNKTILLNFKLTINKKKQ